MSKGEERVRRIPNVGAAHPHEYAAWLYAAFGGDKKASEKAIKRAVKQMHEMAQAGDLPKSTVRKLKEIVRLAEEER